MNVFVSALLSRNLIDRRGGYRRNVLHQFDVLRQFDEWSRIEIDEHVCIELSRMLNYARDNCSFHKDRILADIDVGNALEALQDIPVLTKQDVQQHLNELCVEGVTSFQDATGGSTGEPTVFYADLDRKQAGEAATYWSNSLAGFEYGERVAMLWGAGGRDEGRGMRNEWGKLKLTMRNWIENIRWYDAFDMGEERMLEFHEQLTRFAPHLIVAYAGSIFEYARFLEKKGIRPDYPLKSIVSSAEVLTREMRKTVERVFGTSVFDRYGNREFGPIAAECEAHDGLHINEHDMYVEIDSPDPHEVPGEILVTYFGNRAMPFIRYNTGDVGVLARGECACGRKTKRLKTVDGRLSDSIRTRGGKIIHGEYFTHLMYGVEGVRTFQFVQESLDRYVLRVVCCPQIAQIYTDLWEASIREKVGHESGVRIEVVDEIPVLASGKRKFTVSMIDH